MDYKCEIKDLPEQPILSIRTHSSMISLPKVLGKAFEKLEARLKELGEEPSGAPFVAYYNMNMLNLDIEIGFPVKRVLEGNELDQSWYSISRKICNDHASRTILQNTACLQCPDKKSEK